MKNNSRGRHLRSVQDCLPPSPREMHALIAHLSGEERSILKDAGFITEDEADIIRMRREREPRRHTLEEVLREHPRVHSRHS